MTKGIQTTDASGNSPMKSTYILITAGTLTAALVTLILFQIFRADAGNTNRSASAAEAPDSGKARVSQEQPRSGYAASVSMNGKRVLITLDEVAAECLEQTGKEVLQNLINRRIIQLACEERNIEVSENEVTQEVVSICKEFNIPQQTWYQMLQSERDVTPAQYRRDVIWPMLALRKLTGMKVEITDEELHKSFIRFYGPRVKARMIMCDNLRRANKVWQMANENPDNFERLAREHSIEPNSRALGGTIPPIPRFSGNDALENAAFKLRTAEISGIIQFGTPSRYVILKCEGQTDQVVNNIEEVRETLIHDLTKQEVQASVANVFDQLKQQTRVDNYLTNTSNGGVTQTNGTVGGNVRNAVGQRSPRRSAANNAAPRNQPPRIR